MSIREAARDVVEARRQWLAKAAMRPAFIQALNDLEAALAADTGDDELTRPKRDRHPWKARWRFQMKAKAKFLEQRDDALAAAVRADKARVKAESRERRLWACLKQPAPFTTSTEGIARYRAYHKAIREGDLDALERALGIEKEVDGG